MQYSNKYYECIPIWYITKYILTPPEPALHSFASDCATGLAFRLARVLFQCLWKTIMSAIAAGTAAWLTISFMFSESSISASFFLLMSV